MAFKAIYGKAPAADLKADYQAAVRFGIFRIGREALYFPSFPTGAKYIPLTALDGARVQKSSMSQGVLRRPNTGFCSACALWK